MDPTAPVDLMFEMVDTRACRRVRSRSCFSCIYSCIRRGAAMPLVIRLDAELESGLRSLSAQERVSQAELVRQMIRERLASRAQRKSAFEIAEELGVVGMDADPRRDVAKHHSKYMKATLRGKRTA